MTKPNAEELAQQFHETIARLAPTFTPEGPGFGKLSVAERELLVATFRVLLSSLPDTPQNLEYESSHWQRRCGALLTLTESFVEEYGSYSTFPTAMAGFLDAAYRVVNMNPHTKSIDEPYAHIATLNMRNALLMACAAELVRPGPMAPQWLLDAVSPSSDPDEDLIAAGVMHRVVDAEQRARHQSRAAVDAERERDTAKEAVRLLRKDYEDLLAERDALKSYADGGDETVALGLKAVAECNILREQLDDARAVIAELEGRAIETPQSDGGRDLIRLDELQWQERKTAWGTEHFAWVHVDHKGYTLGASSSGQYLVERQRASGNVTLSKGCNPSFSLEEAKLEAWNLFLAHQDPR